MLGWDSMDLSHLATTRWTGIPASRTDSTRQRLPRFITRTEPWTSTSATANQVVTAALRKCEAQGIR